MKKAYETPVVEKIEFDYEETVTASNNSGTYKESNPWYDCHSSLLPDEGCGYNGVHTSNATYVCGQ